MLKWYIDFDEVLVNSIEAVLFILNNRYNKNVKSSEILRWDFSDKFDMLGETEIEDIFESEEFFDSLKWKDGAKKFLLEHSENGTIVTRGSEKNLQLKREWLSLEKCGEIKFIGLIGVEANKSSVDMSDGILLDDNQHNLYSSNAKHKVLFENNKGADWNNTWNGCKVHRF